MHKTETKKTALRKHPILLALIYAKYACNKFYLFYHDYTINSIVIIIIINAHIILSQLGL